MIVVEVPSVFWIVPKGIDLSKPCCLFLWHADAGLICYRKTGCVVAMVVGKEDLGNVGDTEFYERRLKGSPTRINKEGAVSITENTCVNMSVVNV